MKIVYERRKGPEEVVRVKQARETPKVEKEEEISVYPVTSVRIEEIEGIGPMYGKKLRDEGMRTTHDLLEAGSTPKGRKDLAEKTGISEKLILE